MKCFVFSEMCSEHCWHHCRVNMKPMWQRRTSTEQDEALHLLMTQFCLQTSWTALICLLSKRLLVHDSSSSCSAAWGFLEQLILGRRLDVFTGAFCYILDCGSLFPLLIDPNTWLWLAFVRLYHGSHWLVGYSVTCSCPVYSGSYQPLQPGSPPLSW